MKKATKVIVSALIGACITCTASGCTAIDSVIDSPLVSMFKDLVEDAGLDEYLGEYFDFGDFFNGNDEKESAKDDASDSTESGSDATTSSRSCEETGIHEYGSSGACVWCGKTETEIEEESAS